MPKPECVFKAGPVRVAVFRNVIKNSQGQTLKIAKITLEVRYRDAGGQWRSTPSLSLNEIPKAITALNKAYDYLLENRGDSIPNKEDS